MPVTFQAMAVGNSFLQEGVILDYQYDSSFRRWVVLWFREWHDTDQFVVCYYREGRDWDRGHYSNNIGSAFKEYQRRCRNNNLPTYKVA